jgi:hypothetical protein
MDASSLKTVLASAGVDVSTYMPLWERAQALAANKPEPKSGMFGRLSALWSPAPLSMPPVDAPKAFELAHPVYTLEVPRKQIVSLWDKLMGLRAQTGHYPVILGDAEHLMRHFQSFADAQPLDEALAAASAVDARAWLDQRWGSYFTYDEEFTEDSLRGEWKQPNRAQPPDALERIGALLFSYMPKDTWYLGLVGTVNSWEVPAYLSFGDWNECPPAEVHVALHRAWGAQYGAEIAAVEGDIIVCRVAQPPATQEAALALARDQMMYAEDIVLQGVDTLDALAGDLYQDPAWFFWWD